MTPTTLDLVQRVQQVNNRLNHELETVFLAVVIVALLVLIVFFKLVDMSNRAR